MPEHFGPDLLDIVGALIVSIISGFISIARRITSGHPASPLWVISEFMTAILCGYLMYGAYPHIVHLVPNWFTLPIAVAFSAHVGGKIFQEMETEILRKFAALHKGRRPDDLR